MNVPPPAMIKPLLSPPSTRPVSLVPLLSPSSSGFSSNVRITPNGGHQGDYVPVLMDFVSSCVRILARWILSLAVTRWASGGILLVRYIVNNYYS